MDANARSVRAKGRSETEMKIKVTEYITEIEADARELRESQPLASNLVNMLNRAFQSREPFDDDEEEQEDKEANE